MPNKIYDIVLDTKRFSFNHDVRGVKQGDNNALLNITLTQNSIPLNLTGMGIRINYKRPDGEVFLQATTTTNATEGQIKVNILTKVLEKVGEVKADLCIFDIDNRKITSVTFTIFVDASIYTNDYIEEHDLDMIQQSMDAENARIANENLRVNNENARVISELNRIEKENTRESNETKRNEAESTRENNEKDRIANEDIRIVNEKNRIANETNRVVKFETIKSDYNTYRKTMTSESNVAELQRQINENTEQLKENATKTLTSDSNFIDLKDAVGGFANLTIEGNTIDIYIDGVTTDFTGKISGSVKENPNIAKITGSTQHLFNPSEFTTEVPNYNYIGQLDNSTLPQSVSAVLGFIPQQLFSFNIIEIIERKYGKIDASNLADKIQWCKNNISSIICNWLGYGSCPSGNKAKFTIWNNKGNNSWDSYYDSSEIITSSTVTKAKRGTAEKSVINSMIQPDGFVHFLAYTDPSDGTTPSIIYTDYVNLEVTLKPCYKSVGEDGDLEILSRGKNLLSNLKNENITGNVPFEVLEDNSIKVIYNAQRNQYVNFKFKNFPKGKNLIINANKLNATIKIFEFKDNIYNEVTHTDNTSFIPKSDTNILLIEFSNSYKNMYNMGQVVFSNIQLEEGTTANTYESYKEDKINILNTLRGLSDGVRDVRSSDGTITRKTAEITLNGNEDWRNSPTLTNSFVRFFCYWNLFKLSGKINSLYVCDFEKNQNLEQYQSDINEGCYSDNSFAIKISKTKLTSYGFVEGTQSTYISAFKAWLQANPTKIVYELETPVTEDTKQQLSIQTFKNGSLFIDSTITPYTTIEYASNINSRVSMLENTNANMLDSLGGAWRTLLILADRELKMKSISTLTTETPTDLKNKINEMIGAWK